MPEWVNDLPATPCKQIANTVCFAGLHDFRENTSVTKLMVALGDADELNTIQRRIQNGDSWRQGIPRQRENITYEISGSFGEQHWSTRQVRCSDSCL